MIAAFGLGLRSLRTPTGAAVGLFAVVFALLVTSLLGVAAELPSALSAGGVRQNDRYPAEDRAQAIRAVSGRPLVVEQRDTLWHGRHIGIVRVADAAGATPPPGVRGLPAAGRSVVSPALADLLRADRSGQLAIRVPHPVGTIGPVGLADPAELFAYVGVTRSDVGKDHFSAVGWGFGPGTLFRSDISPFVALPIAALVVAPILALLTGLLQLDQRRRAARLAGLRLLGATRAQCLAADAGSVLAPLLVGWAAAWPLSSVLDSAFAGPGTGGRLFFGSDLRPSVAVRLGLLALLVVVAASLALADTDPAGTVERIEGSRRYRTSVRSGVAAGLVGLGILAVAAVLVSDPDSPRRSAGWIYGATALLVAGATIGLPVLILGLSGRLTGGGVSGELVHARLAGTRSSWRSAALSLLLAGTVAGTALSVLVVLDAAGQTDQIQWRPDQVAADAVFAALPAGDLTALAGTHRFGDPVPIVPAGQATIHGAGPAPIEVPAVYLPCAALEEIIGLPVDTHSPCQTAWVLDDALNPHTPAATVTLPGAAPVATGVRTGSIRAPVDLLGGTESVLLPVGRDQIRRTLRSHPGAGVHAIFALRSPDQVEQLRNRLWHHLDLPFQGAVGSLSTVVSKADFVADGHRYTRNYARLVLCLLVTASGCALIAAALATSVDSDEQTRRNAVLAALGARPGITRRVIALGTYLPALTAMACGAALGSGIGLAYLALADYPQLDGPLRGFPLDNMAAFATVQLLAFAALATPIHLLALRRARTVSAGTLTGL